MRHVTWLLFVMYFCHLANARFGLAACPSTPLPPSSVPLKHQFVISPGGWIHSPSQPHASILTFHFFAIKCVFLCLQTPCDYCCPAVLTSSKYVSSTSLSQHFGGRAEVRGQDFILFKKEKKRKAVQKTKQLFRVFLPLKPHR